MNTSKIYTRETFYPVKKVPKSEEKRFSYRAQPLTMELAKKYILRYDIFVSVFGEEVLAQALKDLEVTWGDFASKEFCEKNSWKDKNAVEKGYIRFPGDGSLENNGKTVRGYKHVYIEQNGISGEASVETMGYNYILPDGVSSNTHYQMNEDKLIRYCIELKYPFMRGFAFSCYSFHYDDAEKYEIYVETIVGEKEDGNKIKCSLYVPMKALENNSSKMISERMEGYCIGYCSLGKEGFNEERYKEMTACLNTEECRNLFAILDKRSENSSNLNKNE